MSLEDAQPAPISRLRATAHPLRLQMLSLLTGATLSAAEVARELDLTQANASYHLRVLHGAGLLDLAGEENIRGGIAKRYHHVWDAPEPPEADATEAEKLAYVRALADAIPARFAERVPRAAAADEHPRVGDPRAGAASEPVTTRPAAVRRTFTDADLWVEPEVWDRVMDLVVEASRLMHSAAQPPRTHGTQRANLSIAAFPLQSTGKGAR